MIAPFYQVKGRCESVSSVVTFFGSTDKDECEAYAERLKRTGKAFMLYINRTVKDIAIIDGQIVTTRITEVQHEN